MQIYEIYKDMFKLYITYRKSCRETVCGSCSLNVNGCLCLLCSSYYVNTINKLYIYPIPHMFIKKNLITNTESFYKIYKGLENFVNIYQYLFHKKIISFYIFKFKQQLFFKT